MGDMLRMLEGMASAAVGAFPAMSISLAYLNGSSVSTIHQSGYLVDTPTDTSLYDLGRITNTFTGTVLAHAVASRQLSFSTSVKDVIPELQKTEFPESITLLALATHTSGLPNDPPHFYDTAFHKYEGFTEEALLTFLSTYTDAPPRRGTPEAYSFSNLGAGLLAYALQCALGAPWEALVREVVTGPRALAMLDTTCTLTPEQTSRQVPGFVHEFDYKQWQTEGMSTYDLPKAGQYVQMPAWDWAGNPLRGAGCLRSSLQDMVKYVQVAMAGATAVEQPCRANYQHPSPDPSQCLNQASDVQSLLGYAQQRQQVMGYRFDVNESPPFALSKFSKTSDEEKYDSQSSKSSSSFSKVAEIFNPFVSAFGGLFSSRSCSIDEIGEGVGLLWMTEDWSDTRYMPSGIKFHEGTTFSGSSVILLNPDLQLGVVMLTNLPGVGVLDYSPRGLAWKPADKWFCCVGGGAPGACEHADCHFNA